MAGGEDEFGRGRGGRVMKPIKVLVENYKKSLSNLNKAIKKQFPIGASVLWGPQKIPTKIKSYCGSDPVEIYVFPGVWEFDKKDNRGSFVDVGELVVDESVKEGAG